MAKVVIFGIQDFASLAHFYLTHDSGHEVVAFSVDRDFAAGSETFEGLPLVPFEDVQEAYPPDTYAFFAPLSPRRMNKLREDVYQRIRDKKYSMISYVSSRATVWMPEAIGENCFVLEDNTIQPYVTIGNNVVLWSGNHLGHHSTIADNTTFTSHVVLSGHCRVGRNSFFGVNATVRDGLTIGEGTLVAMAAAITRDTEPWSVYKGNPARKADVASTDLDF